MLQINSTDMYFCSFLFHKCLRLLLLGLYTVSTPRVENDALIVAHICYISFLRCNYYDEYLACEQEDFYAFMNDTLSSRGTENCYLENA